MNHMQLLAAIVAVATGISSLALAQQAGPYDQVQSRHNRALARSAELHAEWNRRAAAGQVSATVVEPSITSGKILTPNVDVTTAPGVPELELTIDGGTVGVATIQALIVSPSGSQSVFSTTNLPSYPVKTGKSVLKFQVVSQFRSDNLNLYSEPGAWTVTQLTLYGNDGTSVNYGASMVSSLFPSVTINVANPGTPDTAPPTIGHGKILTPTVSLSSSQPYFAVHVMTADSVSGVSNLSLGLSAPGGSTFYFASTQLPAPISKGNVTAFLQFQATASTGTYTIAEIYSCDVVNNCLLLNTPAQIMSAFGATTFQVTN